MPKVLPGVEEAAGGWQGLEHNVWMLRAGMIRLMLVRRPDGDYELTINGKGQVGLLAAPAIPTDKREDQQYIDTQARRSAVRVGLREVRTALEAIQAAQEAGTDG